MAKASIAAPSGRGLQRMAQRGAGLRSGNSVLSSGALREYGKQALGTVKMPTDVPAGFDDDLSGQPSTLADLNTYDKASTPKASVSLKKGAPKKWKGL